MPIYAAVCPDGHTTFWVKSNVLPIGAQACLMCGQESEWRESYCPSTHGAAGPFTPPCPWCGYDPRDYGHTYYDRGRAIPYAMLEIREMKNKGVDCGK